MASRPTVDAVIPVPDQTQPAQYWVFAEDRYVRIKIAGGEPHKDTLHSGPNTINAWQSLTDLKFKRLDAVIQVPDQSRQFWVMCGTQWGRIKIEDGEPHKDTRMYGPTPIDKKHWPSLYDLGFSSIDAVLQVPGAPNDYWVFSGAQYGRIKIANGEPHKDTKVYGPKPISDWASLKAMGFSRLDVMLPVWDKSTNFWPMSGEQYGRLEIVSSEPLKDTLVYNASSIKKDWPSLQKLLQTQMQPA